MTLATTTTETLNATANIQTGFASAMDLGGVLLFVMFALFVVLFARVAAPWLAGSKLLERVGARFAKSFVYAVKGIATTGFIAAVSLPFYLIAQTEGETRAFAVEIIGMVVAGYLTLVVIGWLADRAVAAFIDAHPDLEEWGDIFGGEPDEPPDLAEADA